MLRRRFLKVLSLLSFGLLFTDKARGAASTLPPIDDVVIKIRYQGKVYGLAVALTDDPEKNEKLFRMLVRSNERALWALGIVPTPDELIRPPWIGDLHGNAPQDDRLVLLRAAARRNLGLTD